MNYSDIMRKCPATHIFENTRALQLTFNISPFTGAHGQATETSYKRTEKEGGKGTGGNKCLLCTFIFIAIFRIFALFFSSPASW